MFNLPSQDGEGFDMEADQAFSINRYSLRNVLKDSSTSDRLHGDLKTTPTAIGHGTDQKTVCIEEIFSGFPVRTENKSPNNDKRSLEPSRNPTLSFTSDSPFDLMTDHLNDDSYSFELSKLETNLTKRSKRKKGGEQGDTISEYIGLACKAASKTLENLKEEFPKTVIDVFTILASKKTSPTLVNGLERQEKAFLAAVLAFFDPEVKINPKSTSTQFLAQINRFLRSMNADEKRRDDRYRWFFKRLIKSLLYSHTDYQQSKNFKISTYLAMLGAEYFPQNPEAMDLLGKINFASGKKLLSLFTTSSKFKEAFLNFLNDQLIRDHAFELLNTLKRMFEMFSNCKSNKKKWDFRQFFSGRGLKVPWIPSEVLKVFHQVNHLLRSS